jgi:phosphoglycerate dehydrogenase-like enzyme
MTRSIIAVLPAIARPLVEPHLPPEIEARWFMTADEAFALAPDAEIGWLDMLQPGATGEAIGRGEKLKWVSTIYAGLDAFPLDRLIDRGTILTNGAGVNSVAVAEYAVMGVLVAAKQFPEVVRAQDRREWLSDAPGKTELDGSSALVIGYGTIGRLIGDRLKAFGVAVTGVKRTPDDEHGIIGADDWQSRVGDYDWIVLAMPSTGETRALFGAAEIAAMKRDAWLINIARGTVVDQDALIDALRGRRIGGAFLDVVDPEPLPADSPIWGLPNTIMTMHLSGRAQTKMFQRSAALFVDNIGRYLRAEPLQNQVDLKRGY